MKIYSIILIAIVLFSCNKSPKKEGATNSNQTDINRIVGLASIEPTTRIVSLFSDVGGIVEKINYDINADIKQGDVIIILNSDLEQSQLEQALSKIKTQKAYINYSKAQLAILQVKLENSKLNYNRNTNLFNAGAITQQTFDDFDFSYKTAQNEVLAAQATIEQQEAKLLELKADIIYYQKLIEKKRIKAPTNGKVLAIDCKIGNNVLVSEPVVDFAPEGPLMAITEVDELYAIKIKEGMQAYIRPQGKMDTLATGKIYLTSPYLRKKSLFSDDATNMEDRRVREVRVLLDNPDKVLIGSRVECVISLTQ